ncbi:hypothetical protein Tco_1456040 [Tanacetum coccineum]
MDTCPIYLMEKMQYGKQMILNNKRECRRIVCRGIKASWMHRTPDQEEGIDYDEEYAPSGHNKRQSDCFFFWLLLLKWAFGYQLKIKVPLLYGEIEERSEIVKPDGIIIITSTSIVKDILTKFDMESVRTATTPYEAAKTKLKDETDPPVNVHLYRSMIGSLMYLTASRPDIMFAVSACSRHQVTPLTSHLNAVKKDFQTGFFSAGSTMFSAGNTFSVDSYLLDRVCVPAVSNVFALGTQVRKMIQQDCIFGKGKRLARTSQITSFYFGPNSVKPVGYLFSIWDLVATIDGLEVVVRLSPLIRTQLQFDMPMAFLTMPINDILEGIGFIGYPTDDYTFLKKHLSPQWRFWYTQYALPDLVWKLETPISDSIATHNLILVCRLDNADANEAAGSAAEAHLVPHSPPVSPVREATPERQPVSERPPSPSPTIPETEWVFPNPVSSPDYKLETIGLMFPVHSSTMTYHLSLSL